MDEAQPEGTSSPLATSARVAAAPAGWFPDPAGIYAQRYWDGEHWTENVLDRNNVSAIHPLRAADRPEDREPAVHTSVGTALDPEPESDHSAAAFATRVLERACDIAGVDVRNNAMTADQAIDALPADLAEATVRVMHRSYATAGDAHNAEWASTKLDEIRARPPEPQAQEQEQAQEPEQEPEPEPEQTQEPDAQPVASITPLFGARTREETTLVDAPSATETIAAGWYRDPARRHQYRYWSGDAWTERVADDSTQTTDPPLWDPPRAAPEDAMPVTVARDDAPPVIDSGSRAEQLLARIRALRTFWVISTVVFTVLTVGYLLLPVNESATSVDGTQTVSLHCGSVLSPGATTTGGTQLTNAPSICSAARHSNTTRVYLFAALALVSVALAAFSKVTGSTDETGHSSQ